MTPSESQWLTLAVCLLLTAAALGYDVAAIWAWGPDASISRVLGRLLARHPTALLALVFWLGLLIGHVWLPASQ
jgi:hypothetical protein